MAWDRLILKKQLAVKVLTDSYEVFNIVTECGGFLTCARCLRRRTRSITSPCDIHDGMSRVANSRTAVGAAGYVR